MNLKKNGRWRLMFIFKFLNKIKLCCKDLNLFACNVGLKKFRGARYRPYNYFKYLDGEEIINLMWPNHVTFMQ